MAEIGETAITPGLARVVVVLFALLIAVVPLGQLLGERGAGEPWRDLWAGPAVRPARPSVLGPLGQANAAAMERMQSFETGLEERSWLTTYTLTPTRRALVHALRQGNEDAYVGRDGWLYFRPSVDSLTGRPFLDAAQLARRAAAGDEVTAPPQPDPRIAILAFHKELQDRGIQLILVPAPAKPTVQPGQLSGRFGDDAEAVQNPSFQGFCEEMRAAGVRVFDPAPILAARRRASRQAQYLRTDTHWTPAAMDAVAAELATVVEDLMGPPARPLVLHEGSAEVRAAGDIAAMLSLSPADPVYGEETVTIQPVSDPRRELDWSPDREAEILVLGDSYSNIYSLPGMGWGESAGFTERLSFHLRRPLDRLLRNDAGAWASRDLLRRDLARGRARLAGKKVVIWEFAARELAVGDWRLLPLVDGEPADDSAYVAPPAGNAWTVSAEVIAVAPLPPRDSPYKDLRIAVLLGNLTTPDAELPPGALAIAYTLGLRDFRRTAAATWREGDRVTVQLQNWDDVVDRYEGLRVSELADDELELLDTWCWAAVNEERADETE